MLSTKKIKSAPVSTATGMSPDSLTPSATVTAPLPVSKMVTDYLQACGDHVQEATLTGFRDWLLASYPTYKFHEPTARTALSAQRSLLLRGPKSSSAAARKRCRLRSSTQKPPQAPVILERKENAFTTTKPATFTSGIPSELTFEQLVNVKSLVSDFAHLEELNNQVKMVANLSEKAGGLDRLQRSLEALKELRS